MAKRKNNTGSICFEKSTGKYRAYISIDEKKTVKRFTTQEEAEAWLEEMSVDIRRGVALSPTNITFKEFATEYIDTYCNHLAPKTIIQYNSAISKVTSLHKIKMQQLTATQIQHALNALKCATSTQKTVATVVGMITRKALALDLIKKNPAQFIVKPSIEQDEVETFTQAELKKILAAAKAYGYTDNMYYIILTALLSGARIGEVLALQYCDIGQDYINITKKLVLIYGKQLLSLPKNKKKRKITMPSNVCEMLKAYNKSEDPTDYIFRTKANKPLSSNHVETSWRKILERAAVPYKKFHCLRHTMATVLLATEPLTEVSKRLGHANPTITLKIYAHAIPGYDRTLGTKVLQAFPVL